MAFEIFLGFLNTLQARFETWLSGITSRHPSECRNRTGSVILRRVRLASVAVQMKYVLHVLNVCLVALVI